MKRAIFFATAMLAAGVLLGGNAQAQEREKYIFVTHFGEGNPFMLAVKLGVDYACELIDADCQFLLAQTDGNLDVQMANMEHAITQKPDGIAVAIFTNDSFDEPVQRALDQGINVVAFNLDDELHDDGNARLGFIGQDMVAAGYAVAKRMSKHFPTEGPIHVLIGHNDPGAFWDEQRTRGQMNFLKDYAAANTDRQITFDEIDASMGYDVVGTRVAAYVQANPHTTAYMEGGIWGPSVAASMRALGYDPGQLLICGCFDLLPAILEEMENGWNQATVDQQPFLQGFLPVMNLHLMKKYGLGGWDLNSGNFVVGPEGVAKVKELADEGVR